MGQIKSGHQADGQLANSKGTILTVPSTAIGSAVKVRLVNTGVAVTVNLYAKATTSRRLVPKDTRLLAGGGLVVGPIILSMGMLIEGDAGTATQVDYWIEGITEAP